MWCRTKKHSYVVLAAQQYNSYNEQRTGSINIRFYIKLQSKFRNNFLDMIILTMNAKYNTIISHTPRRSKLCLQTNSSTAKISLEKGNSESHLLKFPHHLHITADKAIFSLTDILLGKYRILVNIHDSINHWRCKTIMSNLVSVLHTWLNRPF
jgi:hypothetical protein